MTLNEKLAGLEPEVMPRVRGGRYGGPEVADAAVLATVLLVGFDPPSSGALSELLADRVEVLTASNAEEGLRLLSARTVSVLCLGEQIAASQARRFLDEAWRLKPQAVRRDVVLAAGPNFDLFQDLVDNDRLYYLTARQPPLADVEPLLTSALPEPEPSSRTASSRTASSRTATSWTASSRTATSRTASPRESRWGSGEDWVLGARSVLELAGRLAMESREERIATMAAAETCRLLEADHAECLLYDPVEDTLLRPGSQVREHRESAAAGLIGFVARTRRVIVLEHIGSDRRYDAEADNHRESADERFLAVPVVHGERVQAVVVARRRGSRRAFSSGQRDLIELLAEQVAPILARLRLQQRLENYRFESEGQGAPEIFRRAALEYQAGGFGDPGHPLQISPQWTRWVSILLASIFGFAVIFSTVGSIHQYASGPAVVRLVERSEVNATPSESFAEAVVESGPHVAADNQSTTLRSVQEVAETKGIEEEPDLGVVALLPGRYGSLLQPGMPLRLELQEHRHVYYELTIEAVGREVIGPAEARNFLGVGLGDAAAISEPVIRVHARLPAASFAKDGRRSLYLDGSQGTAEVRVRSERIIRALIPGFPALTGRLDG